MNQTIYQYAAKIKRYVKSITTLVFRPKRTLEGPTIGDTTGNVTSTFPGTFHIFVTGAQPAAEQTEALEQPDNDVAQLNFSTLNIAALP
jgi:hypothetical protein